MIVGKPVERIEDLRLLRGRGQYIDDLHEEGMLHAAILRSSVAHGVINRIETATARKMPGVRAIFTARDMVDAVGAVPCIPLRLVPLPELEPFEQPVIAHRSVRYVGEPVAIVLADTLEQAEDALEAIGVDIDALPAVVETQKGRLAIKYTARKGDALAVNAPYVRRERFSVQRHTAACLEPRGLLARWDGAKTRLTVSGAAKVPFATRRMLARNMDLPEDCIDMLECEVGGGFGVRGEFYPEDFLVPFAARKFGQPVKWVEDRRENLLASNHAREVDCELEIACEKDGTIVALRGKAWVDTGAYMRANASIPPRTLAQFMSGPYRIPNVHIESFVMLTNKTPMGTYRGPGRFEADFFRERLMEMAAHDLGIEPLELRRRNLPSKDEMPYLLAAINSPDRQDSLDSGDYGAVLERCLAEFNWREKSRLQGRLIDGRYHGVALACFNEGGGAGPRESARMALEPDGTVSVGVGAANVGQGLETVCLQIAADALSLPIERLRIFHGSTTHVKEGFGAFHSRSVVMAGNAIVLAAQAFKDKIRKAHGVELDEEVLQALAGEALCVEETFANHKHTYSPGAAAAHVAVDPRTGKVTLVDYVTVEDLGKVINPLTAIGQAIGAVVQGLGGTLLEELQYDEHGQFLTGSLADYLLPSATDFTSVRAFVTGDSPSPYNPLGVKGGGEGGIVPVGAVVSNAVANALAPLGAVPLDLPLTPPRVWELIREATSRRRDGS